MCQVAIDCRTVKEEPKSPAQPTTRKRKAAAYSAVNGTSLGLVDVLDEEPSSSTQPNRKRTKTAGSSAKLEAVVVRATRNSKRNEQLGTKSDVRELNRRLGRELAAAAKTFEGLSEILD